MKGISRYAIIGILVRVRWGYDLNSVATEEKIHLLNKLDDKALENELKEEMKHLSSKVKEVLNGES